MENNHYLHLVAADGVELGELGQVLAQSSNGIFTVTIFMKYCLLLLLPLLLTSCLDEVQVPLRPTEAQLVVDGQITNESGPYSVRLSFTGAFTSSARFLEVKQAVNGARVVIADDRGDSTVLRQMYLLQPGLYQTADSTFRGRVGRSYTLRVTLPDGRRYVSTPERLGAVPAIEQVTYTFVEGDRYQRPDGYEIQADTQDPVGEPNYYRWTAYGYNGRNCGQTGWTYFDTKSIIIRSDQFTDGNPIRGVPILFSPMWTRISQFIEVQQYSLTRPAFQYYRLYREQQERTGTIFDPLPAPIEGNVFSVADSSVRALGYFSASAVSRRRLKIVPDPIRFTEEYVRQRVSFINDAFKTDLCTGAIVDLLQGWD